MHPFRETASLGVWSPGVRMFRHLKFRAKASVVVLSLVVPLLALLAWQAYAQYGQSVQDREDKIRSQVEVAIGVVHNAYALETSGKLTHDAAQALAKAQIGSLRYSGTEYFFILDGYPRMLMHPIKRELEGRDLNALKDPSGFTPFVAMRDAVKRDGKGFVAYLWPKPGSDAPVDKVSYVEGFEPWGWIVATGLYVDDLRAAMLRRSAVEAATVASVMLLSFYLFACFYVCIDGGLRETSEHLRAMTNGDLTTEPHPRGSDEASDLVRELVAMQAFLRTIVSTVRVSSDGLLKSSTQIAGEAQDLSARTEQQASSLEQSASAMEQIASTVKSTADHTVEATSMAQKNAAVAADGGRAMQEVIGTMNAIRDSSKKIIDIIGTIDGIAFQTNILALNAAVEAARAGEGGRGFAVVAAEVRSLSQRSAEAAKQIKTLIGTSVDLIGSGTTVVARAGETINEIVAASDRVRSLLSEVSTGAREQTIGVSQVGAAINDLDRMTQQNAGMVEGTVAASVELMGQAEALSAHVARFRLPDGHQAA